MRPGYGGEVTTPSKVPSSSKSRTSPCSTSAEAVRPRTRSNSWMRASVAYAMAETVPSNASASLVATRLPELVLIEVQGQQQRYP